MIKINMVDNFPKKCIKCKRTDVQLHEFSVSVSENLYRRYGSKYRTRTFSIPVCENCKSQFTRYVWFNGFRKFINICTGVVLALLIFEIFFGLVFFDYYARSFLPPFLYCSIVFIILTIILYIIELNHPHKIKNYVNLRMIGTVYDAIKDPEYKHEVLNFLKTKIIKQAYKKEFGINVIYCPWCGSKQDENALFCLDCGKDLRVLQKDNNST